ncbi:hypothetical protein JCM11491_004905 [Sporobolomyces phaffii]
MMTTRRLSGMPQQSSQQFGIMLETYEAFRKKHQAQNKEIITKNSELHKTNAELLQHRSVIQAQNLSLKGTLLQTEAELLNVKDRLYRTQENERELREELARVRKRGGIPNDADSNLVNQEQLEVMRQALAAAMIALQAFQCALPSPATTTPLPSPALTPESSPPESRSRPSIPPSRPVAPSQKVSLADRPSSMSVSTRLLVAEPPELSFIVEGESDVEPDEDDAPIHRVPQALPLPFPMPKTSTSRSTVGTSAAPILPPPVASTSTTSRPVPIAKSLQPRSSSSRPSPPPPPPPPSVPVVPLSESRAKLATTTNRRLSGLVKPATVELDDADGTAEDSQSTRRSRTSSRRASTIASRPLAEASDAKEEDNDDEAEVSEDPDDDGKPDRDEDFTLPPATSSGSRAAGTRRRQSTVLREVHRGELNTSSPPLDDADEVRPRRRARKDAAQAAEVPEDEDERAVEPETENVRTVEKSRSARRKSILPTLASGSRDSTTPEPADGVRAADPPSRTTGGGGGSALLQARKESLKKEKEAAKLSASGGPTSIEQGGATVVPDEEPGCTSPREANAESRLESNTEEDGGAGGRRARKSVNYALPKLNTKMRRPADYVSVTSSSSSSSSNKPRKSTKSAPRSSSASATSHEAGPPPVPPVAISTSQPAVVGRQPSLAGKISKPTPGVPFKPVPPPLASLPTSRRSNYAVVEQTSSEEDEDEDEEADDREWSETKFLANLKKKDRLGASSNVSSRRASHTVVT